MTARLRIVSPCTHIVPFYSAQKRGHAEPPYRCRGKGAAVFEAIETAGIMNLAEITKRPLEHYPEQTTYANAGLTLGRVR